MKSPFQASPRHLPPTVARAIKRAAIYPRYWYRTHSAERGFKRLSACYPHPHLFIAGLPKSGTTWLERMLTTYPGFRRVLIPDVTLYELQNSGSHDYELPDDIFVRLRNMLVVSTMHIPGSLHNAILLKRHNVPYVVLYRDLRDVAVSHYFYVRHTPWHPEYPIYRALNVTEGLLTFAERSLLPYAEWVRSWHLNRDKDLCVMFTYEEMVQDTTKVMTQIATHFGLDSSDLTIEKIVEVNRFERFSGGRKRGEDDQRSFFRKGIIGDWRNYFSPAVKDVFKHHIGDFLIEFEYEEDDSW